MERKGIAMSDIISNLDALCDSYELEIRMISDILDSVAFLATAYDISGDETLWRVGQELKEILKGWGQ